MRAVFAPQPAEVRIQIKVIYFLTKLQLQVMDFSCTLWCRLKPVSPQMLKIMKLTFALLTIACLHVSAKGVSQTVTFSGREVTLQTVFDAIATQTGYTVFYNSEHLEKTKKVTVNLKNASIEGTLKEVLKDQGLTYSIVEKTIIIKKLPQGVSPGTEVEPPPPGIDISGKVVNEKGEPVVGASITVKGQSGKGTSADENGFFILKGVDENATLVISGVNIETREFKVEGKTSLTIATITKVAEGEELIVKTNYYSTSKRLSTGNISKITAKEITNQPVTSPLLALQGRVPGLDITLPGNSAPGIAPTIRIRGLNSLRLSSYGKTTSPGPEGDGNYPLYVINGVPISSIAVGGSGEGLTTNGYDPLSTINPEDIESIEVLKDADATAIYGSRGANGVILITTKSPAKGLDRTNFDVKVYKGVGRANRRMELLNTKQYLAMRREGLYNDGVAVGNQDRDLKFWDQTRYTDWQNILIGGTAKITDVQAAVSTGNATTSVSFNIGYHKETLISPDDFGDYGYNRVSGLLTFNHSSRNKKFNISTIASYGIDRNKLFSGDFMTAALTLAPNAPKLYTDDGSLNWEIHSINGVPTSTWINPLSFLLTTTEPANNNFLGNTKLSYQFLSGLSLSLNGGFTNLNSTTHSKIPISSQPPAVIGTPRTGALLYSDTRRMSWVLEPQLTYTKKIGGHNIEVIGGASWQKSTNSVVTLDAQGYTSDALLNSLRGSSLVSVRRDDATEYKYVSAYGRISYNWDQKFLLNLTGRRDGSSRFKANNHFGSFGSIGAGWIFSEEQWVQKALPFLTFGKLRASFGTTGSDAVQDYSFYNLYRVYGATYQGVTGLVPSALFNPDFRWETTKKLEFGIELSFWKNRIGLEISAYRNRSSNQLVNYPLSTITGFPSVLDNFDAVVQNTGLEGVVRATLVDRKHFNWNTSFNFSLPSNKLLRFDGIENSPYATDYKVGEPLAVRFLYVYKGVNSETGLYEFEDLNKDGLINVSDNSDRQLSSPLGQTFYGGLNNSIVYKGLELSFLFQYSVRNNTRYLPTTPGLPSNQSIAVLDRWFTKGDITDIQKFSARGGVTSRAYSNLVRSTYNIEDASFIRLKTLSVGYLLGSNFLKKTGLEQAKVFLQGQNLFTLTPYTGLDPETGSGLPPLQMITGGIQVRF